MVEITYVHLAEVISGLRKIDLTSAVLGSAISWLKKHRESISKVFSSTLPEMSLSCLEVKHKTRFSKDSSKKQIKEVWVGLGLRELRNRKNQPRSAMMAGV